MNIEKLKAAEPLFGSWFVDSKISEGKTSKFYKVYKTENGQLHYLGLKTVRFPSDDKEISAVIASGRFANIDEYLNTLQKDITKNMQTMLSLRSNKNIVRFDNFSIVRESSCFYVVILMELLTPLAGFVQLDSIKKSEVLRLGQDICNALEGFRQIGIIHHDIKSENIYVDSFGNYKLGDFGIFDSIYHNANDPSAYIAPELYNKTATVDTTSDIYSLGILLYKLLNSNRMPFLPAFPQPVSLPDREQAFIKCMRGELLPAPENADPELASIIFKATAFRPDDRYFIPSLFAAALHRCALSPANAENAGTHSAKAAPIAAGTFEIGENSKAVRFDTYEASDKFDEDNYDEYSAEEDSNAKPGKHWYFIVLALAVVLALIVALITAGDNKDKDKTTSPPPTQPTQQLETTAEPTTEETTTEETTTQEETTEETTTEETTTEETTTEPTTTEPTTTETTVPTTTEPLTEPTLVTTDKKNGDKSDDGKVYLKISTYELTEIPEDEFFKQVILTVDDNFGDSPEGGTAYLYQMSADSIIQKVSATVDCEINEVDGDIICIVTVEDSDFYYEPDTFQYYLCLEEGAIASDTTISLPLQIRIK